MPGTTITVHWNGMNFDVWKTDRNGWAFKAHGGANVYAGYKRRADALGDIQNKF